MNHRIAVATCQRLPQVLSDDAILVRALETRGLKVIAAPWNGPFQPFADADLTLVRSTWDYPDDPAAFLEWIGRFESGHQILNPSALLRWNAAKDYLFELAQASIPMAPLLKCPSRAADIKHAIDQLGLDRAIIKPVIGASAGGLSLVDADDEVAIQAAAEKIDGDALVQAFLPAIQTAGEISLMFMGGEFTHAVRKLPKAEDIRVQAEHGGSEQLIHPGPALLDFGHRTLAACPIQPTYARVDVVADGHTFYLMEVELIEPALFFRHHPPAADRLASRISAFLG